MAFDTVLMGRQLRLRGQIYAQLEPSARDRSGLSLANRILVLLIILAAALAVVETEPLAIRGYEAQAHAAETLLGFIFLTEYLVRLWIAPEHHAFADSRCPRLAYVVTFPALIDLLAVLPMLLEFGLGGQSSFGFSAFFASFAWPSWEGCPKHGATSLKRSILVVTSSG